MMRERKRERERADFAHARARDISTADITEGRKNSEGPSLLRSRRSNPEAMFDQLVTTGTWDIVTNGPG